MDFPDPEELEWLESHHSNFQDDDLDYQLPPSPQSEPEPPESPEPIAEKSNPEPIPISVKPTLSLPPKPSISKPQGNAKKRFRVDAGPELIDPKESGSAAEEKRSKVENGDSENGGKRESGAEDGGDAAEEDEEWLRYSPPLAGNGDADVEMAAEEEVQERYLSRYMSEIDGDCVPVTGLDGERIYAKFCRAENVESMKKLDLRGDFEGLSRERIRDMMERVEHLEFSKALQASTECENDVNALAEPVAQEQLWVDKYAPSTFMELLSDEHTNREVLLWLKQWDSCVFGSEIKSTADDILSALKRHSSVVQHSKSFSRNSFGKPREGRWSKDNFRDINHQNQENKGSKDIQELWDKKRKQSGPPEQKILLLCGPPGLGKTTLAHVAARHCGYRVVEINASDDRSSSTVEAKILDAVQMNSVVADSKPKCLVIDEIDGALGEGKGAVEVILKMVAADRKADFGKENEPQDEGKLSKKKQKKTSLLRPVICICNDLYAPALRQLRQVAKVHVFVQPTVSRVVNRLKYICNKEGVKTTSISLTALAEYTECDIRSCLNTLQFLNKKKQTLNTLEISSQVVGRKDKSKSALEIWKEVFQKRREKRERKSINAFNNKLNEFDFLHSLISNRGDYDLILDGIYENFLQLQYYDPMMHKTVTCLDNLEISNIFHKYIMRTQQMSLQVYQPQVAVAIHGLIAQVDRPNIEWPKSFQRYRTSALEKLDVLRCWQNRISPHISRHLSPKYFTEELISPLLHILSPPTLKPVAMHLLSEKDKREFANLVELMVSYAVSYKNLKPSSLPGSLKHEEVIDAALLSFDPPLADFIKFKGYDGCHFVLASAVKQVLVHEVEKHKILQASTNRSTDLEISTYNNHLPEKENLSSQLTRSCRSTASTDKQINAKTLTPRQETVSTLKTLTTQPGGESTSSAKANSSEKKKKLSSSFNFFDRFRKSKSKVSQDAEPDASCPGKTEKSLHPVLFKFNEGFTNAVKRPVRIREFLM
ncbi:OLC1v1019329C1 [Oldenlandia corymbosa var. corymbosa]|uniref:Chromosome transmission fidelity protein 18 homolog n=1 Tax=Oldenlandia corymbosa var. corymbosa TaxID=529605 RepID=A0AAV1EDT0_OLDCO|nr:OLC1v1019329C1 [Oldenlandia corymbosa var. corymbosa]